MSCSHGNFVKTQIRNRILSRIYCSGAISSLAESKGPGADGIPVDFYQTFFSGTQQESLISYCRNTFLVKTATLKTWGPITWQCKVEHHASLLYGRGGHFHGCDLKTWTTTSSVKKMINGEILQNQWVLERFITFLSKILGLDINLTWKVMLNCMCMFLFVKV